MTYCLDVYFKPALPPERLVRYFAARPHFTIENEGIFYRNKSTSVHFSVKLRAGRSLLLQETIVSAEFEINYCRPGYFGIEAEREVSDFVATFRPRIEDDQIRGMGEGPYSREGFLSGWNFGNLFCLGRALSSDFPDFPAATMPAEELRATWDWNYHLVKEAIGCRWHIPHILFCNVEGRASRVAIWPDARPVSLPEVDYVLRSRIVAGENRYGVAAWSEVLEIAGGAGFDTTRQRLDLHYNATPASISTWVGGVALVDSDALTQLDPEKVIDEELIATARANADRETGRS